MCNIPLREGHFSPPCPSPDNYGIVPYVGALDSPPEVRGSDYGGKNAGSKPGHTCTKGLKPAGEKAPILTIKTALIDETLKFSRMRWTISQGMVSQSLNDT